MTPTWNVDRLVKQYGLRRETAAEIVAGQVQHALRTAWQAWAWLAVSLPLTAWAFAAWRDTAFSVWPLCLSLVVWYQIGVRLAQPRIAALAQVQRERIERARQPRR